ncbi:MAG TPA: quinone-dependent dihydroorotate dehydrogenase [Verrucomicrobiae bacterium]|nr:quinone-dependent dihydroorotate dehydrogenase [Verrucomicrobiae bacterium]
MEGLYRDWVRPMLFAQDAERAHNSALKMLGLVSRSRIACAVLGSICGAPELPVRVFGLKFPNPVGLAAGMDKHAVAVPAWEKLGFGFSELGGVTWHPQPGNPRPRMFRAVADEAIVNRMGFNNSGAEAVAKKLLQWKKRRRWPHHPIGINLGKSKITPLEEAAEDYAGSFHALRGLADFFVINVSSPNTPGLRQLQDKAALDQILAAIQKENAPQPADPSPQPAILVKVAPDLSFEALDEILELAGPRKIAGIVATNTTIARPETDDAEAQKIYTETGGLSGRPLRHRSTEIIRYLYKQTNGKLPIIGVGGIFDAEDAWEKIAAGASLVQVYTGLVYEGPGIARKIVRGLIQRMEREGVRSLKEVVGSAN